MTKSLFTPRPLQIPIIEHLLEHERAAAWASMGAGKTSATLYALDMLDIVEPGPTLILGPLRVAQSTWPDEVAKWSNFSHMRVRPIVGTKQNREMALAAALNDRADIFTTNYENIPWIAETLKVWRKPWPFTKVVADEATRLKSFRTRQGGKRAQILGKIAHKEIKHFIELTGTPAPNGLADLWGQAWFLDQGSRLGLHYSAFSERWFRPNFNGFGSTPMPHAQSEIHAALRDLCLTIDAEDYFDIDKPISNIIYVDLPIKARSLYTDMEKVMYMEIEGAGIEALNAAARTMKCSQLANGAAYKDGGNEEWHEVHDVKLQALESIINEAAGMPVLVSYFFKSDLARLLKAFPRGRALDKNPQTIRDWNAGRIPILFAHPQSAGHGLNLADGGNILVDFALTWNLEYDMQILERIGPLRQKQANFHRPVYRYRIVARDTVDEMMLERVTSKRDVQDILLEAMKRKKQ